MNIRSSIAAWLRQVACRIDGTATSEAAIRRAALRRRNYRRKTEAALRLDQLMADAGLRYLDADRALGWSQGTAAGVVSRLDRADAVGTADSQRLNALCVHLGISPRAAQTRQAG